MGKKDKNKKKGKGAEKTAMKTDKKLAAKQKKLLEKLGEADIAEIVAKLEVEESRRETITEELCSPPSPRANFSFVAHPEKDELILFGGEFYNGQKSVVYNDLFMYNIPKNEWKQLRSPAGPAPRSGHQMVALAANGGQLWLFGGEHISPSQMQFYHFKDLWLMSLKTRKWEKVNAPNGPSPRSGHRMVASKKNLIVFGGFHDNNQSFQYFNDVHVFSLDQYAWLKVDVGGALVPAPRSGCCMAAAPDGRILVWGGYAKTSKNKGVECGQTFTDMFALVPDKTTPSAKFKWLKIKPGGYKPAPRSGVGFTIAPNGKVYCYGGVMDVEENEEDLKGQFGDELLSLDLAVQTWHLIDTIEKSKYAAGGGDEAVVSDVVMNTNSATAAPAVVTDGIFTMTVAGSSGSTANARPKYPSFFPSKFAPSPRMNPGLCVCKGTLYLFGGIYEESDKQFTYNDFYALDLHKKQSWKVLIPNNYDTQEWFDSDSESSNTEDSDVEDDDDDESDDSSGMDTD